MKALHVICRRKPAGQRGRNGVECIDPNENIYSSDAWVKSGWTPETVVGALLFMHQSQSTPSEVGGEIIDCKLISPKTTEQPNDRYRLIFKVKADCRGVKWRGNRGPTEQGGLVEV